MTPGEFNWWQTALELEDKEAMKRAAFISANIANALEPLTILGAGGRKPPMIAKPEDYLDG